ncbi:hypothetical protein ACWCP6_33580 [Streptomyces sp. NPDC002004]
MNRHHLIAPVVLTTSVLLLAGCGTQKDKGSHPATSVSACPRKATLTAADAGRTVCISPGTTIRLTLGGSPDRPWTPVKATGKGLKQVNAGIGAPHGNTIAAFQATTTGKAELTSSRPLCGKADKPGGTACHGMKRWAVKVEVVSARK